uniref:Uncharacterized protein n=1 Tax=Solanum lycopersicum TaxID=4081 RepID=A0A3Q7I349_SOLLC
MFFDQLLIFISLCACTSILFESIRTPFSFIIPFLELIFFGVVKWSHVIGFKHKKNAAAAALKSRNRREKLG